MAFKKGIAVVASAAVAVLCVAPLAAEAKSSATKSGILEWVDAATPSAYQTYTSSRGDTWNLVMSDEFNTAGRSFKPGKDHLWTSMEKADGVNAALEVYSHNMTGTKCDSDGTCYFYIESATDVVTLKLWNSYVDPPGYQNTTFYYRSGMVQSWNKFCFQGGMLEVRAQLPGVTSSSNPDVSGGSSARAASSSFYPTWPGIWMMGNLGRAIFSASTSRMWPFSYNECNETLFNSSNQRISACNSHPGYGLNANQGRGAPEIDLFEGAGTTISSSIQLGPAMPIKFRMIGDDYGIPSCVYKAACTTIGGNVPDVPTAAYASRKHKTWYQGLRYGANNDCAADSSEKQTYSIVKASLAAGITGNTCSLTTCPASFDVNSDISTIDGTADYWSINSNGTCFAQMNGYKGAYLCSAGNKDTYCPETNISANSTIMTKFAYGMDAISTDWPIHVGAYTGYVTYQLEWVMGSSGYIRWMLDGSPLFEIPTSAIENPPQDAGQTNPKKIMPEEPMYLIMNVALSSSWGSTPPNPTGACSDGSGANDKAICSGFPLYLKVDYIRVYQDQRSSSSMAYGCDPSSHPTATWIESHIDEYTDIDNPHTVVSGGGFCSSNDDCTIAPTSRSSVIVTGSCSKSRCKCKSSSWTGPRCVTTGASSSSSINSNSTASDSESSTDTSFGPSFGVALGTAALSLAATERIRMSESWKSKMLRGELFDSMDDTLVTERHHARLLVKSYNDHGVGDATATSVLKEVLGSVGDECIIEAPFRCDYGYNIHLADGVFINFNCVLLDVCEIRIGARTLMGPNVQIYTASHPLSPSIRADGLENGKPIVIEEDVWIGGAAIVLPGVRIGRGSVIGAGSVVTKDVPPMSVYAGNPARFIKSVDE